MSNILDRLEGLAKAFKQWRCWHAMYLDDLSPRDGSGMVHCACFRCGKVLEAECGIALPGTWRGWREDAALQSLEQP